MDRTQGVTMLGDLPDLEDIDDGYPPGNHTQRQQPPVQDNMTPNVAKFLRHRPVPPVQSGMQPRENYSNYSNYGQHPQQQDRYNDASYNAHQNNPQSNYNPPMPQGGYPDYSEYIENYEDEVPGNCRDVCKHVRNCEICSSLYKNDRTIFIIIIVILSVICILLLKKVLKI